MVPGFWGNGRPICGDMARATFSASPATAQAGGTVGRSSSTTSCWGSGGAAF